MTATLSPYSLVMIYSAMAVYLFAFMAFTLDLAKRSAQAPAPAVAAAATKVGTLTRAGGTTATLERLDEAPVAPPTRHVSRFERVAFALTILGWILHVVGTVLRGVAAGRVPWANMWEFSLTGTLVIIGIFLLANLRWDIRWIGTFILGLVCVLLMIAQVRYYVPVVPLPPALQSYWLVVHILVAILGTAFFALGFALAAAQLMQDWRERREALSMPPVLPFTKGGSVSNMFFTST